MTIAVDRFRVAGGVRCGTLTLACARAPAAATKAAGSPADSSPIQIFPGTSSKEPISIDADKLVYFDKEKKAIYSGNVVVIQGDTKMTCSVMTVFSIGPPTPGALPDPRPSEPRARLGRQAARGDGTCDGGFQDPGRDRRHAIYDKVENKVQLIGHVTLSDGQNVTKGDKLTYDLKTGQATIDTDGSKSGRVHGQFLPKSNADASKPGRRRHQGGRREAEIGAGQVPIIRAPPDGVFDAGGHW